MESFDGFIELFKKCKLEKNNSDLTDILKNAPAYFQNLSTTDIGLALSVFLNDKTGLLHLLMDTCDRTIDNSIIEGFKLLNCLVQQFYYLLDQYIIGIKKVCESAIITKCSHYIKNAATECFESLLRMCPSHELKLSETVQTFVRTFHLCSDTERAKFFKALGSIAKYHPEAISSAHANIIFERIMNDFEQRHSKSKPGSQPSEMAIYLEVLNNLLTIFSSQEPSGRSKYYKKLYQYIKELSNIDVSQQFKFVSRAAFALLGRHMSVFADYVYEEATYWHNTLLKWTKLTGENGIVAFNALSVYYEQMGLMLKSRNTESGRKIFEDLMRYFKQKFTNDDVESISLQSSIRGFGHMAGACKNYLTEEDVVQMYSLIAQRTTIMYANNNEASGSLDNIAYYQVALSEILLHVPEVTSDQLTALTTLSLILIKRFPDLPVTSHSLAVTSLMNTIHNVRQSCRRSSEEFIKKLVYEGIIWSCSHALFIDAEIEREMKDLEERPVCYKNYLPLWQPLICRNKMIIGIESLTISIQIFDDMIDTCVRLIKKLNLDIKGVDTSCEIEAFDIPVAVNDTDFRVFINLVDLFVDILEKLEPDFLESKMDWFLCEIITKSNQNPLISGFYKLVHVVLKLYNLSNDSGELQLLDETSKLVSKYLSDTVDRLSSFSGELQGSCFNMIFEMPAFMAENMLDRLDSAFKTAFSLGHSNFDIAQSGLRTLEKWTKIIRGEKMNNFLIAVVPSLESFLQSSETTIDSTHKVPSNERKVIKNIVLTDHEKTLEEFQRKILLFLGSLNSEVTSNLANERSSNNGAFEDDKNLLEYTLMYNDIRPDIYLDTILDRTIELALHSTDRRTRLVACEVLHSMVIVMLGTTSKSSSNTDRLLPLFKKICPAILRLGSDSDQTVQELFRPLMIQLTHWYSSKSMLDSSETNYLIDILFDLLTYESSLPLRDFCGVCLAEFVKWSIKQSTDIELEKPAKSIAKIIGKITNFSLHPTVQKRNGAAVAFNYLYTILRESNPIIDIFWLELLFCFVKSLDGFNSTEIFKSLKHIERVIDSRYLILNKKSSDRRMPAEFTGTLLEDAADWLLVQCGSLDMNCRSKSMELLVRISEHVPVFDSVQKVVMNYVNRNGVRGLNQIILKDLQPKIETLSVQSLKPLSRTLDCYIWILRDDIINLNLLFTDKNANKDMIFNCITNFIYIINVKGEENERLSIFSKQYQELRLLKCEIILKIFNFVKILMQKMETQDGRSLYSYIPTFFWNDELHLLISTSVLKPEVNGFDLHNLEIMESLSLSLQQLLNTFIRKLEDKHISQLKKTMEKEIESKYQDFLDLDKIFNNDTSVTLKNYLKGLIMLESLEDSDKLYERPLDDDDSASKVIQIFNLLKKEQYGKAVAVKLESSEKEYLEYLMEFLCLRCKPNMIITLVNIIDSKTELSHQNMSTTFHGEYFMNICGKPIFQILLRHLSRSMDTLLCDSMKEKFDVVVMILEDLLTYVKNNKKYCEKSLPILEMEFVKRFSTFRNMINGVEKRKEKVMSLYSQLVQVSQNPSGICREPNDLYSWIMRGLFGYLDLDYKTRILNNFLPCIVDETSTRKQELRDCLHKLKSDYYPTNMSNLVQGSLEHSNVIASFQTLARHLPALKSVNLFDCVIHLSIGNVNNLWDDGSTKHLTAYFNEISTEDSKKSLQILYKYFMSTEKFESRLEILNQLLLKCIHFCNANAIERFFEENIKEIYDTTLQELVGSGSGLRNLIVSKIGCYNLLEIMFAKVKMEKISSPDSTIVKNAIHKTVTGRELFQTLNSNVLNVRTLKSNDIDSKELMRLLHCSAYNCSIAIVSLKCEVQFYILPFAENKRKGQIIWENIIDTNRRYDFKQDFKEMPKEYKKLINIRKQSNLAPAHSYSSIKSYNLAASTLNDDLSCFDLYNLNLRSPSNADDTGNVEMMSLTFEGDDLNNHECMAPICGLITHMVSSNLITMPNEGENVTMPVWMKHFQSSFNGTLVYNIQLFMVRVIVNVQEVFKPYAKSFLSSILIFLKLHFKSNVGINYVIKDILVMLIDWHSIAIPSQNHEKQLAQNLLVMLMKNADTRQRQMYKYNIEIINMLVEAWQLCLEVPENILQIGNASEKFIVRMILIFLFNKKQESLATRQDVLEYLMNLLENPDEEIIVQVCNALGLILNYLESKNDCDSKKLIIDRIKSTIIEQSQQNQNRYIKCIYEIHRFYPNIIKLCYERLTSNYFKVDNYNKGKCLELFLTAIQGDPQTFTEEVIMIELGFMKFQDILMNKMLPCQDVALKIIEKLLNILSPSNYLPFAKLIVSYSKDPSVSQRSIVVDIFISVYRKYSKNIEDNIAVTKLIELSRQILLLGLLDTNETLQKKLMHFWTEEGNMTDKSIERMLEIFDMYDVNLESSYLPILPLMMLHLVSKDPAFKKMMFKPLSNCKFEDYRITVMPRSRHVALGAPLFTSSFASQMSQYYSQSNPTFSRFNQSLNQSLFLRATQSLQFEQTLSKDQSFFQPARTVANEFSDSTLNVEKIPQPSKNKKSKRILQNTSKQTENIRQKQISMNLRRDEIIKEEVQRQRNSITMYRSYRIGDFPDTEIKHASLIEPLQELVKNDQVIARDLTVAIFCAMLKEMSGKQKTEFLKKLSTSLEFILDKAQGCKPLVATVLEIILNSNEIYINPNIIAKVSKSCGLLSLGALLLEQYMISGLTNEVDDEPVAKSSRYEIRTYAENDWLQLANIYKAMNDFDIVQSIFGGEKFGNELQEASFAQAASKWSIAKDAYEKAWEVNEGLVKDYCQESLFICLAHLSDWKKINHRVETELNGEFDALWHKPMHENWMASWALQGQIHGMLQDIINNQTDNNTQNDSNDRFRSALHQWVNNKDKLTQLKGLYGEEIAIFYIDQNPEFSDNCLTSGLEKIRDDWKHLNPLYYEQKINKYLKLRGFSDIKTYLRGIQDKDQLVPNVQCMITFWDNSLPSSQDNLLMWDKHIAYRLYFFWLLEHKLKIEASNDTDQIPNTISAAFVKQCLSIAQVAYSQGNLHFMRKYLRYSEQYLDKDNSNLNNEWQLGFAKYRYLGYSKSKTQDDRVKRYIESWEMSHQLLKNDCFGTQVQVDVRQHISSLVIELEKLIIKLEPIGKILMEKCLISQYLPPTHDQGGSDLKQLSDYCLIRLNELNKSEDSKAKASCYLRISMYCHTMKSDFDTGLDLSKEYVRSTLNAMSYGSLEANQYFPCLLHLDYSNDPELEQIFKNASANVETWMFLKWQAQLLSNIGTPVCSLIAPILLRLAETYPNSLVYTFRMTKETNKSSRTDPLIGKLSHILSDNKDLELFLKAMNHVVQPELFLKYHITELDGKPPADVAAGVEALLATVYPSTKDNELIPLPGKVYKVIEKFKEKIRDMAKKEGRDLYFYKKQIINDLDESLRNRITSSCKLQLKEYSIWLSKFNGGDIEVPGQYVGDKKPMPEYHAKIVKLNPVVTVLPSLRKPIRITMLGNDGKNYNFLVKFGEDLRTDERIEQLFMLMNKILQGDAVCRQRQLSIDTYLVVPLTRSLGLIQWVDNTRSLNEIIDSMLTDGEKRERDNVMRLYKSWMNSPATQGQPIEAIYNKAILRYGREEVTAKFNYLKSKIDWDILRGAFKKLSRSLESFFSLRHTFITSYATICIAQWILGIGDRNLSNTLISYTTGKALGIDFGYSFDAAVDSAVPELMPFRLTPQILNFLRPFDENGLLKLTMINVLRAIKRGKDPLLACMDIFVKEPSLDWLARNRILEDRQETSDVKWYPKKKIDVVKDKLNGVKPSKLTLLQIKDRFGRTEYFSKYIDIVNGSDDGLQSRMRSRRPDENLSVEEQVECLLDQATDPNILVRTWFGWEPWI